MKWSLCNNNKESLSHFNHSLMNEFFHSSSPSSTIDSNSNSNPHPNSNSKSNLNSPSSNENSKKKLHKNEKHNWPTTKKITNDGLSDFSSFHFNIIRSSIVQLPSLTLNASNSLTHLPIPIPILPPPSTSFQSLDNLGKGGKLDRKDPRQSSFNSIHYNHSRSQSQSRSTAPLDVDEKFNEKYIQIIHDLDDNWIGSAPIPTNQIYICGIVFTSKSQVLGIIEKNVEINFNQQIEEIRGFHNHILITFKNHNDALKLWRSKNRIKENNQTISMIKFDKNGKIYNRECKIFSFFHKRKERNKERECGKNENGKIINRPIENEEIIENKNSNNESKSSISCIFIDYTDYPREKSSHFLQNLLSLDSYSRSFRSCSDSISPLGIEKGENSWQIHFSSEKRALQLMAMKMEFLQRNYGLRLYMLKFPLAISKLNHRSSLNASPLIHSTESPFTELDSVDFHNNSISSTLSINSINPINPIDSINSASITSIADSIIKTSNTILQDSTLIPDKCSMFTNTDIADGGINGNINNLEFRNQNKKLKKDPSMKIYIPRSKIKKENFDSFFISDNSNLNLNSQNGNEDKERSDHYCLKDEMTEKIEEMKSSLIIRISNKEILEKLKLKTKRGKNEDEKKQNVDSFSISSTSEMGFSSFSDIVPSSPPSSSLKSFKRGRKSKNIKINANNSVNANNSIFTLPDHLCGCARLEGFYKPSPLLKSYFQNLLNVGDELGNFTSSFSNSTNLSIHSSSLTRRQYTRHDFNFPLPRPLKVALQSSSIHSYGLFATDNIDPDENIIEYVGEVVRSTIADRREKLFTLKYGVNCSSYFFRLDDLWIIDASKKGNLSRFINHSCEANSKAKVIEDPNGKEWEAYQKGVKEEKRMKRLIMFAGRSIAKGEEITYDYKFPIELDEKKRLKCLCGTRSCRGYLN